MSYCDDCGNRLRENNICSNCYEELYINDYQMVSHPIPVSDEWNEKVAEQRIKRKQAIEDMEQCKKSGHQLIDCDYCIHG